jgi:iron-sulfur cluster assembly accessory protein
MSVPAEVMFQNELTSEDVNITPAAQAKLAELVKEADSEIAGIRIFVQGGGCSGMQYGMTFTEGGNELDAVLAGDDFKVYIDTVALAYIRGVEIDYVEKQMGASFVFNNVFASTGGSGACGACGAQTGPGGGGCG